MVRRSPLAIGCALVVAVLALGVVFSTSVLQALGDFLVIRDPLELADAIVAVSGDGTAERAATAAALVREGYAPWLILSGSRAGHAQGGATAAMMRHALREGIPRERILIDDRSESTFDNARNTVRIMQDRGFTRAILVTSPYHTRRAARAFRAEFLPRGLEIRVYAARRSFFDVQAWWKRRRDRDIVMREYGKLLANLIGIR